MGNNRYTQTSKYINYRANNSYKNSDYLEYLKKRNVYTPKIKEKEFIAPTLISKNKAFKNKAFAIFFSYLLLSALVIQTSRQGRGMKARRKDHQFKNNNIGQASPTFSLEPSLNDSDLELAYLYFRYGTDENHGIDDSHPVIQGNSCPENLKELVNSKTIIHEIIPPNERGTLHCEEIPKIICQTIEKLPSSKKTFETVLKSNTSLICTNHYYLTKQISLGTGQPIGKINGLTAAVFSVEDNSIYLDPTKQNANVVFHHEFIHNDRYNKHRTAKCLMPKFFASLPLYSEPPHYPELFYYEKALKTGDNRVIHFKYLLEKRGSGNKLTIKEKNQLLRYEKAVKTCMKSTIIGTFDYEEAEFVLQGKNKNNVVLLENNQMKIISIKYEDREVLIELEPVDPNVAFLTAFEEIFEKLKAFTNKAIHLMEREAYTFQHLSEEAQEVFYPEAKKMREHDVKKCSM